ncbi:ATP-dependent Clp protease adaptor ClpS [Ferruginibacter sp. SUN002]|uniref:ATP-dependent Clp protease adaptor ClpS n=1 Tax=Ferruginibacter sp. SUN002 TaxID=2937789 RepID=UPI003D35B5E2
MGRIDMITNNNIKFKEETDTATLLDEYCTLIIWNDEVNTFDWVIETLVDICNHSPEQAEQCAMIIHHKGKYAVKEGSYDTLKPMCDAILDRGIGATIEVTAA